jgi:hypothetical protein
MAGGVPDACAADAVAITIAANAQILGILISMVPRLP